MNAPKRVLIVDDEPDIRETVRDSLESLHFQFLEANNGIEAMEKILHDPPDLIITDYNMPKMNGLQLVKEMEAADIRIPTIWLTGRGTAALFKEASRYGVTDYLDKPFRIRSLQERVRGSMKSPAGAIMASAEKLKMQNRVILPVEKNQSTDAEERSLVQAYLDQQGLTLPDSFLNRLTKDDVIEIYSYPDNRQLYSNREFLRLSSYSLEQMQTIPFQKLFWRSDEIQTRLLERASQVVNGQLEAESWDIELHELVESLHPRKRTFEMQMGLISPCFDKSGACVAWASTLKVQLIYEWPEEV